MRTLLLTLGLILAATAASADSDFSLHVDLGSSSSSHYYGAEWYWGDPALLTEQHYRHGGLHSSLNYGEWDAHYSYGAGPSFSSPRSFPPRQPYQSIITPYQPLVDMNRHDRGGYHPDRPHDYPVTIQPVPYSHAGPRYVPRRHRRGYPAVYQYSYGYYPQYYGRPLYTASSCPEYGYGGVVYQQLPAYDPSRPQVGERQDVRADEVNVYEGDVYNYYYEGQQPAAQPAPPPVVEQPPVEPVGPVEAGPQAVGARFYERLRLETPDGVQTFVLEGGRLYAGPETGPWLELSEAADAKLGAFAAWIPGDGVVVIFREGDRLVAAYPSGGDWWTEPLPLEVDFAGKITLGLVGGAVWVVADSRDGSRYVLGFGGGSWYEIGSASAADPAE